VIETLFYKLNNSVLLGESDNANMYLAMLRDEYGKDESAFSVLKQDDRWDRLLRLGYIVDNNISVNNFEFTDDTNNVEQSDRIIEEQFEEEKSLVKVVCYNYLESLRIILGASDNFHLYNFEHPTIYGFIDVVAQDNDTMYIIEFKKSDARYAVIGQISKYMLCFNLLLINKMWRRVVGVVIANSYIGHVSKELVKLGVIPIKYTYKNSILKLRRLHVKTEKSNNTSNN
jgi:RecB family endonuclease NucS